MKTTALPYGKLTRTLPTCICRHPSGLLVRVQRGDVVFQALIPSGFKGDALAEAIRRRDHFLQLSGPAHARVSSNTGIAGISEVTHWKHSRPYESFTVQWSICGHRTVRHITYGPHNGITRETALNRAIEIRTRMTNSLPSTPSMPSTPSTPSI